MMRPLNYFREGDEQKNTASWHRRHEDIVVR